MEAPGDVGLGTGRGLQSTVNDAEAHHLDNGPQHGVLALKKLSFSSVFYKGFSGGHDVPPITLIPILFNAKLQDLFFISISMSLKPGLSRIKFRWCVGGDAYVQILLRTRNGHYTSLPPLQKVSL